MVLDECADPKKYVGNMSNQNLYVKCVDEAVIIFGKGVFREYLDALHWSIRAMFGDADAPTMGLDGLAIFLALWGLFITSYLIGEVGNAVSNGDPASASVDSNHWVWGGGHQTSELSRSATSKSIRLIFGRIDRSHRVLEARRNTVFQNVRLRAH